jgi:hypothetical protein
MIPVSLFALCRAEREMMASARTAAHEWERQALTEAAEGLRRAIAAFEAGQGAA